MQSKENWINQEHERNVKVAIKNYLFIIKVNLYLTLLNFLLLIKISMKKQAS